MLTPRYAWRRTGSTGPMDRTCVSKAALRKPAVPRRLMHRPPTLATVAEQPPPRTGVLRARLLRPAGRHAMVVAHFFESGQRRRLRWASRERTANGRRSSAGQHRVHSCDRTKGWAGPRRLGRRPGFPQREPALPTRQLESRVREAQGRSSFWRAGSQPSCAAGTGCIGTYP